MLNHLRQFSVSFMILLSLTFFLLSSCTTGYENDGKEVRWHTWDEGRGHQSYKVNADPKTFVTLTHDYGKDNVHAFYCGQIIEKADGKTFRAINNSYACDKNYVYSFEKIIIGADPATFKVLSTYLSEDKHDYYWEGRAITVKDKSSFVLLGKDNDWQTQWAKDQYNGYFLPCGSISGIDYETFHPAPKTSTNHSGNYAVDKNRVYFENKVVTNADPGSFKEVDWNIGQDKFRVYKGERPTQLKDYNSLNKIGRLMYTDGTSIYDADFYILPDADAATFEYVGENWYKDKKHVWWNTLSLPDVDVATFRPIKNYGFRYGEKEEYNSCDFNYGKDAHHVFFQDSIILGADPNSFEIIDFPDSESWTIFDKNRIYSGNKTPQLQEYLIKMYGKQ